jgi:phosphate transport system substrate-binding protein
MLSSSQAIADEVASNPQAVGYYGMGYLSPRQKTVAVAKDQKSDFFTPDVKSVVAGTYPISRPLFLYTRGEPAGKVKEFIDFVFSAEGQKIVEKADFVPIN